jgi:hypothetical protein
MRKKMLLAAYAVVLMISAKAAYSAVSESTRQYFQIDEAVLSDGNGNALDRIIINGPPKPPSGSIRRAVGIAEIHQASAKTLQVPAFSWSFGCAATSAAMIAGYYDRNGYSEIYTGPTNGGIMPMDNSSWPTWTDGSGFTLNQCPLSATHLGLDGRASKGHVDDYWVTYDSTAADPFYGHWTEHAYGNCTGDYMKTNQTSNYGNSDGATTFYNYTNGAPLNAADMESHGIHTHDGGYGAKLFFESRGYTVTEVFNQYLYGYNGNTQGFTFAQYKQEIDDGHPVMIQVKGHTMVGVGYDDTSNTVYLHDTWDYLTHTMTWGGSYSGMQHMGVTVIHLAPVGPPVLASPSPADGATFSSYYASSQVLQVTEQKSDSCTVHYGTDSSASSSVAGALSEGFCRATVPYGANLTKDGLNYWYVEATNAEGTTRYPTSGTLSFTTNTEPVKAMPWLKLLL